MKRPMVRIHNSQTNEIIDREMNDQEFAQYQIDEAQVALEAQEKANAIMKRDAALAKLQALGLTPDDLKALGL